MEAVVLFSVEGPKAYRGVDCRRSSKADRPKMPKMPGRDICLSLYQILETSLSI